MTHVGRCIHQLDRIADANRTGGYHTGSEPTPPHQRVERFGLARGADEVLTGRAEPDAFQHHLPDGEPDAT